MAAWDCGSVATWRHSIYHSPTTTITTITTIATIATITTITPHPRLT